MDFLRRNISPLTAKQWEEIDKRAKEVFSTQLHGRAVVDVVGPFGWEYAAHPTGEIELLSKEDDAVKFGLRKALPLVELKSYFYLDLNELDKLERGQPAIDLSALEEAVRNVAVFEDGAIFEGCEQSGIKGFLAYKEERSIPSSTTEEEFLESLYKAMANFSLNGISGPYTLVINIDKWVEIVKASKHYPIHKKVEDILKGGKVLLTPRISDGLLVSERGGDFELILGQDLSIGYEATEGSKVKLFITETFTFRIITPEALIHLKF
ncbi:MAG: encapsulin [Synergistetes bacterium]|uniref:Maritimacin n=1 Tax=Thermotoga petrophila TaxID=93929 RepID=A0A117L2S9_9THEM|nr:MAG: Maritimacin [Thermotoga petrophila]MBC7332069.1 encapsulin [Synergistota bacterium]MDK2870922.1 hypothetical protein [bacterium]